MRKALCLMLMVLAVLALLNPSGAEETETPGVWYGFDKEGTRICYDFQPKGVCVRTYGGFTKQTKGKWTQDGKLLTVKMGSDTSYLQWNGETMVLDGMGSMLSFDDIPFSREKYDEYFPAKAVKSPKPEEFDGLWELRYQFDTYCYRDMNHRDNSMWYYYPDESTAIYFIRIDAGAKTVSMLNLDKEVLGTHGIEFRSGQLRDKRWNDTYFLMEDGALFQKKNFRFYFFRVQE